MKAIIERLRAEEATGIQENPHGLGKIYSGPGSRNGMTFEGGTVLQSLGEIVDCLLDGQQIAIPNAGAGSYHKAFSACGMTGVKTFDTGSSAGDWSFLVTDGNHWYPAFQTNRYPYHGFLYMVEFALSFDTEDECLQWMSQQ